MNSRKGYSIRKGYIMSDEKETSNNDFDENILLAMLAEAGEKMKSKSNSQEQHQADSKDSEKEMRRQIHYSYDHSNGLS